MNIAHIRTVLKRGLLTSLLLAAGPAFLASPAAAQSFPSRPVKIIVPFPPGGSVDIVARILAQRLQTRFQQTVTVENVTGATGQIGMDRVAKAPPDGYTAVLAASGGVVINVHLMDLPYDPSKDLAAITRVVLTPTALAVAADLPVRDLKGFVDYVKARPGKVSYGVSGIGSQLHIAGELLKLRTGIDMTAVPYRGTSPTTMALVAGEIPAGISDISTLKQYAEAGKVRMIAAMGDQRAESAPDIPTVAESGVPGFLSTAWLGLFTTGGTPKEVVDRWYQEVTEILQEPEVLAKFRSISVEAAPNKSPAEAVAFVQGEIKKWGEGIKQAGIKISQ
ncbi:MAG: tripartite tricarboxylate transporter substrate binding protein [Burkholderiales bacterium]|nr:tripartite tricarboxylate transporter substrate binding protein [Burkholderiales bacterium]